MMNQQGISQNEKATLIYIGDPMCSWCYGFAPELDKIIKHFGETIDFDIVMGGLRPYNKQSMTELKDFLTHHWEDVSKASGQEFCYDILNEAQITYDTEPPCRATVIVRQMEAKKAYPFFKLLQSDFYLKNKNLHLVESYKKAIESLDLDFEVFRKHFQSNQYKLSVRDDFTLSGEMGIRGFPSLVLEIDGKKHLVSNGYGKAKDLIERIERLRE